MNNPNSPKKFSLTKAFAAVAVGLALYGGYNLIQKQDAEIKADAKNAVEQSQRVPYTQFVDEAQKGMINRIEILPNGGLVGTAPGLPPVLSQQLPDDNIAARLENQIRDHKIEINVVPSQQMRAQSGSSGGGSGGGGLGNIFLTAVIFGGVIIGLQMLVSKFRGQGGGGANMSNIGKSKARMIDPATNNVTFDDVAGCDEAKEEVKEIVDFLREPHKFSKLGAKIPKGGLLVGPPGTGKTMLAKAVAKEAGVPFFTISGSDFVEMFVGVGAARVRDMFEVAKKHAPCIIFIDEIDAVGGKRGGEGGGGNSEREQTLNQILVEMDGVEGETGVVIFGATNRPEMLDPALLRPGRFDRQVYVTLPDIKGREQILRSYARKSPLSSDVDLRVVARGTPGMSGADLANLINEAALMAGRREAKMIEPQDFDTAKDKIMMGTERRTAVMPEHELRNTAYHETGHMLMNKKLPQHLVDPFYKMTIMPRGRALGMSMSLPTEDRYSASLNRLKAEMVHLMGGRMAEIKKFGWENVTGGASNDIERATDIARNMVMKYGMSKTLGAQRFVTGEGMSMLGGGGTRMQPIADDTMKLIDDEVKALLAEAEAGAAKILDENEAVFEKVSLALLKWETLTDAHVEAIFRGEDIDAIMKQEAQIERQHRMEKNMEQLPGRANDNQPKLPKIDRFTLKK